MAQLDTRIPMQVPNVLAQQAQVTQNNRLAAQSLGEGFNAVQRGMAAPLLREGQALQNQGVNIENTAKEQQLLGGVLQGLAEINGNAQGITPQAQAAWAQARGYLVQNGVFEDGELPEALDMETFQGLSAIATMPTQELTDWQRKMQYLTPEEQRSAARINVGIDPRAQAESGYTLRPGDTRMNPDGSVAASVPATPKAAPGVVGELEAAIQRGFVPEGTTVQQFTEMKRNNPDSLPSSVRIAQYMFPNDMDAQRKYLEDSSKRGTVVNNNMGGNQSEFGKKSAAAMADRYVGYLDGQANAETALNGFVEMRRLLSDADAYVGAGAEYVLAGKKALQALGVDVTGVASSENLVAQSSRAALDALSDLKGVASDTDMRVIMNTAARITDTREGAIAKIAVAERAAQYRIQVSNAAAQYVAQNGELDAGWFAVLNQMSARFRDETLGLIRDSNTFAGYQGQDVNQIIDSMIADGKTADEIDEFLSKNGMLQ